MAYLAAHSPGEQPHLEITEFAHLRGHDQAALALLRDVGERSLAMGLRRAVIRVGGNAPLTGLLEAQRIPLEVDVGPGLMVLVPNREWIRAAGFRRLDDAIESLFRSSPPVFWHRDGY